VSSRRDKEDVSSKERSRMDKSVKRREKESPARGAPAKKKRARVLSSSSSGSDVVTISSSDDLYLSSSSEDEAIAEVKIIDDEEEKQLRVLREQEEVQGIEGGSEGTRTGESAPESQGVLGRPARGRRGV
jgi:hypothetical protein